MKRYFLNRCIFAFTTVLVMVVINFFITKMVPGDPVVGLIGEYPAPPEYVVRVRHDFGLDQPIYIQLYYYLSNLLKGDLGFSFANRQPVLSIICERAGHTLLLMLPALFISALVGIALALAATRRQGGLTDNAITVLTLFGFSMPSFWLAQLCLLLFAVHFRILPASGMYSLRAPVTGWGAVWDLLSHMLLPLLSIVAFKVAVFARTARASILGIIGSDFILTARAKGLGRHHIFWRHVLPNAIIPIVAVFSYQFGYALTSSLLIETVFGWPGVGYLFVNAISQRDFPVIQGVLLLSTIMIVAANLFADVLYPLLDPRIRGGLSAGHD